MAEARAALLSNSDLMIKILRFAIEKQGISNMMLTDVVSRMWNSMLHAALSAIPGNHRMWRSYLDDWELAVSGCHLYGDRRRHGRTWRDVFVQHVRARTQ